MVLHVQMHHAPHIHPLVMQDNVRAVNEYRMMMGRTAVKSWLLAVVGVVCFALSLFGTGALAILFGAGAALALFHLISNGFAHRKLACCAQRSVSARRLRKAR
jgi:hypothetical protein